MNPRVGTGRPTRPAAARNQPRGNGRQATAPATPAATAPATPRVIELPARLTVKELAERLGVGATQVIKELLKNGVLANINQTIDYETAAIVAHDLGFEVKEQTTAPTGEMPSALAEPEDDPRLLVPRPPIVTILGHVDHGKTTLLDAIRQTNVAAGEAGGITQHIGAYQVEIHGQKITFLDTPGHEAFTAMRARGAQVTDIAVLVVAADDGVQPQTLEAIDHARAANVPIIVALNKIDKPEANPDRVKQQLAEVGLVPEDWGGDTIVVPVSARRKTGIDQLLEMILLVAEMQELKANPNRPARGVVIEAKLDKARGPVATLLVQNGTLHVGDFIVVGPIYGRVRAMFNDRGKRLKQAGPATPVEILGLPAVPQAGDKFVVAPDEKTARAWAQTAQRQQEEASRQPEQVSLEDLFQRIQAGQVKELNLIVKTDVQGSIEPIRVSLERLSTPEVTVKILHSGTGNITESDVLLAQASKAIILGFNVKVEPGARRLAEQNRVDIRLYSVIYDLVEDVQKALTGLLAPKQVEVVEGHAEVRQVFRLSKGLVVAGCYVTDGKITRQSLVRVRRGDSVIFDGRVASLKRFKDDVREVAAGFECGVTLEGFTDFQVGDVLEAYTKTSG
jgi:translation initiation factor IF-2